MPPTALRPWLPDFQHPLDEINYFWNPHNILLKLELSGHKHHHQQERFLSIYDLLMHPPLFIHPYNFVFLNFQVTPQTTLLHRENKHPT